MEAPRPRRTPASRTRRTSPPPKADVASGDVDNDEATPASTQADSDTTSSGVGEEPSTSKEDSGASTQPSAHETEGKDTKEPNDKDEYPEAPSVSPVPSWNKAIASEKPEVHWNDITGLDLAKKALKESVILPVKFPHLFKGKRISCKNVLLYGPPDAGKAHLVMAVAMATNSTLLSISSSALIDKWLNESEKIMKSLFERAKASKPAVILINEIDLLCKAKYELKDKLTRQIVIKFLEQLQGGSSDNMNGILVFGTTEAPWNMDAAIRQRFPKQIYIPSEVATCRRMFENHIGDTPNELTEKDFQLLGERSRGYSEDDISIMVREALMMPIRKLQAATHFKTVCGPCPKDSNETRDDLWTPCSPQDPGAQAMTWTDIEQDKLLEPRVKVDDFLRSLENIHPTVNLRMYEDFSRDYGQAR